MADKSFPVSDRANAQFNSMFDSRISQRGPDEPEPPPQRPGEDTFDYWDRCGEHARKHAERAAKRKGKV